MIDTLSSGQVYETMRRMVLGAAVQVLFAGDMQALQAYHALLAVITPASVFAAAFVTDPVLAIDAASISAGATLEETDASQRVAFDEINAAAEVEKEKLEQERSAQALTEALSDIEQGNVTVLIANDAD